MVKGQRKGKEQVFRLDDADQDLPEDVFEEDIDGETLEEEGLG